MKNGYVSSQGGTAQGGYGSSQGGYGSQGGYQSSQNTTYPSYPNSNPSNNQQITYSNAHHTFFSPKPHYHQQTVVTYDNDPCCNIL